MVQIQSGISALCNGTSSQRTEFYASFPRHTWLERFVPRMSVGNEIVCRTVAACVPIVASQWSFKKSRIGSIDVFRWENTERSAVRQDHPVLEFDGVAVFRGITAINSK